MEGKNYYAVKAKCGHVGKRYYYPVVFGIIANNGVEAAKVARNLPRVKHDHKDAILFVKKICLDEYNQIILANKKNPYLKCKNIQEQNKINEFIKDDLVEENDKRIIIHSKAERKERVEFKAKKNNAYLKELMEYKYSYIYA